ncbi:MAG: alpha-L-arabinofuranosidase C-terminal domain-containing protein [Chitinophagaceae bacterium]
MANNSEPDSVYLLSYTTSKNNYHNGLHFAWSRDRQNWFPIGNEFGYLRSDYGRWGAEKRMIDPFLLRDASNTWHCIWSLNEKDNAFAHAASSDLVNWGRQSYPLVAEGQRFMKPAVVFDKNTNQYQVMYESAGKYFKVTTKDFKTYTVPVETSASAYNNGSNETVSLPEGKVNGQIHRVTWSAVEELVKKFELQQYRGGLHGETTSQDATRFAGLKPVELKLQLQPASTKPISDLLVGVFFEDINYAADGGLYAEMVQNRGFEYQPSDRGNDRNWNSLHSWKMVGENTSLNVETATPIHPNNPHYAVLKTTKPGAVLLNEGFDGFVVKQGDKYDLSLFSKQLEGKKGKLQVRLVNKNKEVIAEAIVPVNGTSWKKAAAVLTARSAANDAILEIQPLSAGTLALDMISLFPQKTFMGRKNGLRADLAQTIADIKPRFIRFPGGCVAHGDGLENMYRWPNTVGPLEARKPQRNLWGYHQTAGLGYFEYFQFCEDIGAEPLPVVPAAVPCQNSGTGGAGQQGGVPMEDMDEYIQEVLNLVEYANGSVKTKWGKVRAEAGHPKPFNLKYIGIGNEDLITDVFEERFTMIFNAMKEKHPEITVIGTVGPFFEGTDYEEGWHVAEKTNVPMVDEHYYLPPGWFIHNQDFYDKYDRSKSKVYLGEYAAHLPGRPNNIETALAEALYLTSIERNGDVVAMTSYAPLLAKEGHTQWSPDLIYFNNAEVKPTVGYHVQKLYGQHAGTEYLPAMAAVSNNRDAVKKRIASSVVRDAKTGDVVVKLVNMLPVEVKTSVDMNGVPVSGKEALKVVLKGDPASKEAKPVESRMEVGDHFNVELAPYSFTVIRIKTR